ncbi:DNA polymerase Y family protein [Altererythrobacter endophyticus]|uniref:DNA polymerase Y family protein n=2 Tax=Altericroceibacterium endophyticum TaxID=1808508 RepID=A0A6I4T4Y8_9SPHN|nr:DNA polymerase Y family protein [Altericroceibacterium endophyticum]MXO65211.1 DNA polymerase Y family protein [Altericroceibacterium endophyticum]
MLPFFPAERRISAGLAPPDTSFALIEKQRGALRIMALSPAACRLGLAPGMMLADARAQVPELLGFPHEEEADRAVLTRLALACEIYTPLVAAAQPYALLLDCTGCFDAVGMDEAQLGEDLTRRLVRHGFQARTAWAATPDAALACAVYGQDNPHDLPVEALELGAEVHQALRRSGLMVLGDLACRPSAPLAARFGTALPMRLAALLEEQDRRLTPLRSVPPVRVERRFPEPLALVDTLLKVIADLAGEAEALLAERGEGGRRFEVLLFRTDGHVAQLAVDSALPLRDPAAIADLFGERIASLADPLDPGFGYDVIRLAVSHCEALEQEQSGFTEDKRVKDTLPLLNRLAVRFGADSIRLFHPRNAHLPEYAASFMPVGAPGSGPVPGTAASGRAEAAMDTWPEPECGEPPLRPLFLFDPPQRVQVMAQVPDGPPRRFQWRGKSYRISFYEGPERIAYPWWKHPEGSGPTRDYYRVEDEQGHRFWLFRHGLYERESDHPHWYIHGQFA